MNKIFFKKVKKFILLKDIFSICNYSEGKLYNKKIFGKIYMKIRKVIRIASRKIFILTLFPFSVVYFFMWELRGRKCRPLCFHY